MYRQDATAWLRQHTFGVLRRPSPRVGGDDVLFQVEKGYDTLCPRGVKLLYI